MRARRFSHGRYARNAKHGGGGQKYDAFIFRFMIIIIIIHSLHENQRERESEKLQSSVLPTISPSGNRHIPLLMQVFFVSTQLCKMSFLFLCLVSSSFLLHSAPCAVVVWLHPRARFCLVHLCLFFFIIVKSCFRRSFSHGTN